MAAVLLALAASASWGVSDFLGGLKTRAAKTAEAAVLYHANQLDAVAATRPVDGT